MSILEIKDQIDICNPTVPTGWADITAEISEKPTGANNPTHAVFRDGIRMYSFSPTAMNECFATFHLPHSYKEGSPLYFHTHWSSIVGNTGVVRWGFEYSYAKGYQQEPFPASQTVYVEQAGSATAYLHHIAETVAVTIPGCEVDGLILVRIFRDAAHANDTHTQPVFLMTADVHHQVDRVTTANRNFPFYT